MAEFLVLVAYGLAWWIGCSVGAALLRKSDPHRLVLIAVSGLYGFGLSTIILVMLVPPALTLNYILAPALLGFAWHAKNRANLGLPIFDVSRGAPETAAEPVGPSLPATLPLQANGPLLIDRLRSLCFELVEDGTLDEDEIHTLNRWMLSHPEVLTDELARLLADHLSVVLADGEISPLESIDLFDLAEALATGKTFDEMRDWKPLAISFDEEDKKPRRRAKREGKPVVKGAKLGTISFSYRNANGEYSDRRVAVQEVGGGYFKGRCLTRKAQRTFRIDRILGDVVSEDTGEVLDAYEWAETVAASQ